MLLFDIKKAFDSVDRPLLWKILIEKCKTREERHILELIIQLHSNHTVLLEDGTTFNANRGLLQGTKLSPKLFNVYLHYCLSQIPQLKIAIEKRLLLAWADDMIYRTTSIVNAKTVIAGMEQLKKFGLEINKSKSQALEGPTCLQELKDLCGIPIVKKVKYLGYTFSARRDQLIRDAKANIQKHAN